MRTENSPSGESPCVTSVAQVVARGEVLSLGDIIGFPDEETLLVGSSVFGETEVPCQFFAGDGGSRPSFLLGDKVLFWKATELSGHGVVLGRLYSSVVAQVAAPRATITLEAAAELTLRVGDGSITIRKDGKILIKGTDLVSHAKRMNCIKGGAVSIN